MDITYVLQDNAKPRFTVEDNVLCGRKVPCATTSGIGEMILRVMEENPDFISQIEARTEKQSTFREMRKRSVKCALWLKQQGLGPGDIIGICTDNHIDTYIPVLAISYTAATLSTWDHELCPSTAKYYLDLISPKVVFANADSVECLVQAAREENKDTQFVVFGRKDGFQSLEDILSTQSDEAVESFKCTPIEDMNGVYCIVPSSGTTGMPKGVMLSFRSTVENVLCIEPCHIFNHTAMWTLEIRWHYGLLLMLQALVRKSKRIIIPDVDDDIAFCEYIQKFGVTAVACDPCVLIRLLKKGLLEKYRMPTIQKFVTGGAQFRKEFQESFEKLLPHAKIIQIYAMTDTGGTITSQNKFSKPGSAGHIAKNLQLKVVDTNTGETLDHNRRGEIWVRSETMMLGYYKNPEETRKAIDENGWLHTGDVGYYDEDYEVFIVDRISQFINYRGINVSPATIESVLQTHPAVMKAAVTSVSHEIDEEHIVAFVIKQPEQEVSEQELNNLIERSLPWYCAIRGGIKFVDSIPLTPSNKIARKQLKEMATRLLHK